MSHDHEQDPPSEMALRVKALETLLTQRGYVDPSAVDKVIDHYQNAVGPRNGAKVVAKAWTDTEFKKRLLENGTQTIAELGFIGLQGEYMVAVENTPSVHNLVVCTLCSCYPWSVLGLPPSWYKSHAYRSRAVREPRAVLKEFGVDLDQSVEVNVWDSTSEVRYLVIPQRPEGSNGLSEAELADLVTTNSMIGTHVLPPVSKVGEQL